VRRLCVSRGPPHIKGTIPTSLTSRLYTNFIRVWPLPHSLELYDLSLPTLRTDIKAPQQQLNLRISCDTATQSTLAHDMAPSLVSGETFREMQKLIKKIDISAAIVAQLEDAHVRLLDTATEDIRE
jgi:hypothetical protein